MITSDVWSDINTFIWIFTGIEAIIVAILIWRMERRQKREPKT
jgi:hypothetical protein